jgi:hypothetical protein
MPRVYKLLLLLVVGITATVVADTEEEKAFTEKEALRQEQVHDALNTVKEDQLLSILYLTPEEENEFLGIYHKLEDMRIKYRKEKIEIIGELQEKLAAGDIASVAVVLNNLESNEDAAEAGLKSLRSEMRALLRDEQYAKFVVFETNFEKKLMRLVMENRAIEPEEAFDEGKPFLGAGAPAGEATEKE